jgi:hypothetical protein
MIYEGDVPSFQCQTDPDWLEVHYRVHNSPVMVRTLTQMNLVHTFPPYFSNIRCNIIFPSTATSSK